MKRNRGGFIGPLPGGGPWLILAECPAQGHNTQRAAEGYKNGKRSADKCVCPRAVALYAHMLVERRDRQRVEWHRRKPAKAEPRSAPQYAQTVKQNVAVPDLRKGLCRTQAGMRLMDAASKSRASGRRKEALEMCLNCPVMIECGQWVTQAEDPPGSWGGIYGGMTTGDRRMKKLGVRRGSGESDDGAAA